LVFEAVEFVAGQVGPGADLDQPKLAGGGEPVKGVLGDSAKLTASSADVV
jgi:hypothetical protein